MTAIAQTELSESDIASLRDRWETDQGRTVRAQLLFALNEGDESWPDLLADLPQGSTPVCVGGLHDLRGLTVHAKDLDGVSLSSVDMSYSRFIACSLNAVSFQCSKLVAADFSCSEMCSADLLQVDARHAKFDDCNLRGAMMMCGDFQHGSFQNTDMQYTVLNRSNFLSANLTGADLLEAEYFEAKLPNVF